MSAILGFTLLSLISRPSEACPRPWPRTQARLRSPALPSRAKLNSSGSVASSTIVKEETGKERRLHVSGDTEVYGQIKPGDLIEAWVQPDGHVKTIMIVKSAPAAN